MISKKMEDALNEQINAEIYSAYLYLSMYGYFQSGNLPGFANWMEIQTAEEYSHARKFYNHIIERNGKLKLKPVDGPPDSWKSPAHVFEEVLKHEQMVTSLINNLVDLSIQEKDHAANIMLQWFVSEQVEEEASAGSILDQLKLIGDNGNGLFLMDRELGQRTANPLMFQASKE